MSFQSTCKEKGRSSYLKLFYFNWNLDAWCVFGEICVEFLNVDGCTYFTVLSANLLLRGHSDEFGVEPVVNKSLPSLLRA